MKETACWRVRLGIGAAMASVMITSAALAQTRAIPTPEEQQALMKAVNEGQNSSIDMLRALEEFLSKFPNSSQRAEIYKSMTRAAIDIKDDAKVVKYGVPALESAVSEPSVDPLLLDRVARSLLALVGQPFTQRFALFLVGAAHCRESP